MTTRVIARAQVRVPATTANLGAGFDCLGLALDRWLRVSAELRSGNRDEEGLVTFHRTGTLTALDRAGIASVRDDLIWQGFERVLLQFRDKHGFRGSVHFEANSDIPVARGLGSSAAALLAGAALANEAFGLLLSAEDLARLCTDLEGHGDNVGAAALGGAVLVTPRAFAPAFSQVPVHESLGFAFAVPSFETRTDLARAALPSSVPFRTAVLAASKAASLVRGLQTADRGLLTAGLNDVLHVEHRKPLIPHYERVARAARNAGAFGATLSGSGSSIVAVAPRNQAAIVAGAMAEAWRAVDVPADAFATGVCPTGVTAVPPTSQPSNLPTYGLAQPIHLPRRIACP
ncbi:MAG: homoserine kinase [Gemmatimonadota bacterium]|nr:homoserine kinase [Gemmatimonadota bacterium]